MECDVKLWRVVEGDKKLGVTSRVSVTGPQRSQIQLNFIQYRPRIYIVFP